MHSAHTAVIVPLTYEMGLESIPYGLKLPKLYVKGKGGRDEDGRDDEILASWKRGDSAAAVAACRSNDFSSAGGGACALTGTLTTTKEGERWRGGEEERRNKRRRRRRRGGRKTRILFAAEVDDDAVIEYPQYRTPRPSGSNRGFRDNQKMRPKLKSA
ncbi:hypothetical protein AXG93_2446s1120 [Marchantia polymorpha subsp. ruderalis]|uniref:Uncharacterized protein n=1 Tax=Marchantia polymorpha subsp. ruderalis TaxID=1480154 RepID=A0A176W6L4_MARPO|nr:hypothetical protein AXG93_2446s1120 [Marchantia polymorpha subsp. ruderalis]